MNPALVTWIKSTPYLQRGQEPRTAAPGSCALAGHSPPPCGWGKCQVRKEGVEWRALEATPCCGQRPDQRSRGLGPAVFAEPQGLCEEGIVNPLTSHLCRGCYRAHLGARCMAGVYANPLPWHRIRRLRSVGVGTASPRSVRPPSCSPQWGCASPVNNPPPPLPKRTFFKATETNISACRVLVTGKGFRKERATRGGGGGQAERRGNRDLIRELCCLRPGLAHEAGAWGASKA